MPSDRRRMFHPTLRTVGPLAIVAATVAGNLWVLRATTTGVAYLDDSSVQEEMVRAAESLIRAGHDPLTSWFPYLGLGSPQFLHYQSAPAILTAIAGLAVGPEVAYRWSLYLLWCLWPIAIFLSARVFRLHPWAAAAAAAVSPLLASVPGVGYEQKAYIWIGYGVWAQLWASWALPFAWAFSWRAMEERRFVLPAAAAVALTAVLHFETGYLAIIPLAFLPFLVPSDLRRRVGRALAVLAGGLLASAWVTVPLVVLGKWASVNTPLQGGPLVNGYGARQVLGWLVTGRLLDNGRFPVVTLLAAVGLLAAVVRWRREPLGRALVTLACIGLVLSFGRTTFGPLVGVLPGSIDLFFRRFAMGAQLGAIYLAGAGAAVLARAGRRATEAALAQAPRLAGAPTTYLAACAVAVCGSLCLVPGWRAVRAYDALNASDIQVQSYWQARLAGDIGPLVDYAVDHGGGRVYAGLPSNWGHTFTVGYVPVLEYLTTANVDEVGFTLRTASLMTNPEFDFDEDSVGEYSLFGIRYLLLPTSMQPPVPAKPVLQRGPYRLWEIPSNGYLRVVDTVGSLQEDRKDIAAVSLAYTRSSLPAAGRYLTVGYAGGPAPAPTLGARAAPAGAPGEITASKVDLADGTATATVRMARRAVVVLSASYDPGWEATVDGRPAKTEMLAPALVGVEVPAGEHQISFRYVGFGRYPELFALALLDLLVLAMATTEPGRRMRARVLAPLLRRSRASMAPRDEGGSP